MNSLMSEKVKSFTNDKEADTRYLSLLHTSSFFPLVSLSLPYRHYNSHWWCLFMSSSPCPRSNVTLCLLFFLFISASYTIIALMWLVKKEGHIQRK